MIIILRNVDERHHNEEVLLHIFQMSYSLLGYFLLSLINYIQKVVFVDYTLHNIFNI